MIIGASVVVSAFNFNTTCPLALAVSYLLLSEIKYSALAESFVNIIESSLSGFDSVVTPIFAPLVNPFADTVVCAGIYKLLFSFLALFSAITTAPDNVKSPD